MAVKIRLARQGRKNKPMYRIVIADASAKRDGRFIEKIGTYNPHHKPATIRLQDDQAVKWLLQGAQPTDTVHSILSSQGVMFKKHLQQGVQKKAITQAIADQRFATWQATYQNKKRPFVKIAPQTPFQKEVTTEKSIKETQNTVLQLDDKTTQEKKHPTTQTTSKEKTSKKESVTKKQPLKDTK